MGVPLFRVFFSRLGTVLNPFFGPAYFDTHETMAGVAAVPPHAAAATRHADSGALERASAFLQISGNRRPLLRPFFHMAMG